MNPLRLKLLYFVLRKAGYYESLTMCRGICFFGVVSSNWIFAPGIIQHLADSISTNTKSERGTVKYRPLTFGISKSAICPLWPNPLNWRVSYLAPVP